MEPDAWPANAAGPTCQPHPGTDSLAALDRHSSAHMLSDETTMAGYHILPSEPSSGIARRFPLVGSNRGVYVQFLTNIFFVPFLALRAAPAQPQLPSHLPTVHQWPSPLPTWSRAFGVIAAAVGAFSVYWALFGRPGKRFASAIQEDVHLGPSSPAKATSDKHAVSLQSTEACLNVGSSLSRQPNPAA